MSAARDAWYAPARGFAVPAVFAILFLPVFTACDHGVLDSGNEPGEQIMFLSTRVGATDQLGRPMRDILRMDANGEGVENVTRQPAWEYRHLDLSPDGSRIAYSNSNKCDIRLIDTDGSDPTSLTNQDGGSDDGCNHWPRWSPDGTRIAFATNREGRAHGSVGGLCDAYVMNTDGSNPRNVSHSTVDGVAKTGYPAIAAARHPPSRTIRSPDGTRIAFDRDAPDGSGTSVINADGSGLRRLTDHPTRFNGWSPAGTRIAFTSRGDPMDVYVVSADGSGLRDLTRSPHDDSDAL
jgi:Tol biopolymer transport system component